MIRPAAATDVPALLALEADLFGPDAWSEASLRDELDGSGRRAVVLVSGAERPRVRRDDAGR